VLRGGDYIERGNSFNAVGRKCLPISDASRLPKIKGEEGRLKRAFLVKILFELFRAAHATKLGGGGGVWGGGGGGVGWESLDYFFGEAERAAGEHYSAVILQRGLAGREKAKKILKEPAGAERSLHRNDC